MRCKRVQQNMFPPREIKATLVKRKRTLSIRKRDNGKRGLVILFSFLLIFKWVLSRRSDCSLKMISISSLCAVRHWMFTLGKRFGCIVPESLR